MNKKVFKFKKIDYIKGMTLVELLVCLSIFVIVTGLTMFDYGSFRSNISIQNLASDISLTIRKAQSYAIGARKAGDAFNNGFGVHFTLGSSNGNPLSGSSKSFIMFSDLDNLKTYNIPNQDAICGDNNECNEVLNIDGNDIISGISYDTSNSSDINLLNGESIDISFKRPNPYATFYVIYSDGNPKNTYPISRVTITISNGLDPNSGDPKYRSKTIIVSNTGQISVK